MNKYLILILVVALFIGVGVGYKFAFQKTSSQPAGVGNVKNITITAVKNEWRFTPENVDIIAGDTINLTVINQDEYDHGLAIDAYGISQRMPAKSTIQITFTATKQGDFPMYCSVPCGEGIVAGKKRTHFDMISTLHVKEAARGTQ